jgi:gas vesicle protein
MSKKNQQEAFFGGILLGTTMGAIVGLLIAPRSGKETRTIVKKSAAAIPELAEDISSSLQLQAGKLSASALKNWDDTLNRLQVAIAAGLKASQQESQQLTQEKKSQSIKVEESECN